MKSFLGNRNLTTALLLILAVVAVAMSLILPQKAQALCLGIEETEKYYSDATLSHQVGWCRTRECPNGSSTICTGQQTEFFSGTSRIIQCNTSTTCSGEPPKPPTD